MQKFPYILEKIGGEHRGRSFAIIIDEAHSSQGGKTSSAISTALSQAGDEEEDETMEDTINRIMEAKKLLPNSIRHEESKKRSCVAMLKATAMPLS